ncbi:DUF1062 domain-containing protein [Pelagibius sp. Alg239-R121]|uniref:DUF1062 domain-containing protein n=1 Tax=Pelagibius sp. Alg239-R121 TaxID=2993448 RepID=UPI0024A75561|nr:DUF1062 domain-containing protein [Pelagibius sp. Alg239-R121]
MSSLLSVRWTVKPITAPRPWLPCSGCGKPEAFQSSGKFRINASGKRLDAWLLYRCIACETSWKRPLIERRHIQTLDPSFLSALQSNDSALAETLAFDLADLLRFAARVEVDSDVLVDKKILSAGHTSADLETHLGLPEFRTPTSPWAGLEIALSVPVPITLRTDRLLARELRLPRARVRKLEQTGRLAATLDGRHRVRRPAADQVMIRMDLSREADAFRIARAAAPWDDEHMA